MRNIISKISRNYTHIVELQPRHNTEVKTTTSRAVTMSEWQLNRVNDDTFSSNLTCMWLNRTSKHQTEQLFSWIVQCQVSFGCRQTCTLRLLFCFFASARDLFSCCEKIEMRMASHRIAARRSRHFKILNNVCFSRFSCFRSIKIYLQYYYTIVLSYSIPDDEKTTWTFKYERVDFRLSQLVGSLPFSKMSSRGWSYILYTESRTSPSPSSSSSSRFDFDFLIKPSRLALWECRRRPKKSWKKKK